MTQLYIWMHQVCLCHSHMFKAKSPYLQEVPSAGAYEAHRS